MMTILSRVIAAIVVTISFSILYSVPKKYYIYCGIIGGAGAVVTNLAGAYMSSAWATFFATLLVVFLARIFAVWKKCPTTVFMIAGIFFMVPGANIYWTAYHIVMGQGALAMQTGFLALKTAGAIVLGIALILAIPQGFFRFVTGQNTRRAE